MFVLSSGDAEEKYRQLAEENDAKDIISGDLNRIGSAVVVAEERMYSIAVKTSGFDDV